MESKRVFFVAQMCLGLNVVSRIFVPKTLWPVELSKRSLSSVFSEGLKHYRQLHPRKLTCPLKMDYFSREYIFQPLIFRGHSLVSGGYFIKP